MIRAYLDMAADMFHIGHLNLIKRSRNMSDYLIVGVHSDLDIASYKRLPIIPEYDRYEIVRCCKYVDEVITSAPLSITKEFIEENKINVVIRGDDKTPEIMEQLKVPMEMGIVKFLPRTENISTSDIIRKIKESK
jgi:cytidyltransferase-like protein